MLIKLIELVFKFGPLVFGVGFMAPLFAELISRADVGLPFGLTPLIAGLVLGGGLGLFAQVRGSWIWAK